MFGRDGHFDRMVPTSPVSSVLELARDLEGRLVFQSVSYTLPADLAAGTYGRSIWSNEPIPDERLEADPAAELTVEEEAQSASQ